MEIVASLSQGRTAAAQCGLFTHKSVPVIFEPPCTWRIFCYFVTFTISEEYTDYEAIYTADISSAYGRLECSAVLSGGGSQTHGPSVHFDCSLTDTFSVPLSGTARRGRFLKFKMIFTTCSKAATDFYVP